VARGGLLQPLDTSRIAGWNDLNPGIMAMKNLATTADGKAWFMPWDWGNTALTYNSEKIKPEEVTSLKAFADPKFKGRVSIGDNVDDAYALASLVIGLKDWTVMTDEQFKQASDFLREVHKNVRLYWTDTTEISRRWAMARSISPGPGTTPACNSPMKASRSSSTATRPKALHLGLRLCAAQGCAGQQGQGLRFPFRHQRRSGGREIPGQRLGLRPCQRQGDGVGRSEVLKTKGYADVEKFVDKTLFQSPVPRPEDQDDRRV
jgi:spermidine/putrescine transport system substrate-binding protein